MWPSKRVSFGSPICRQVSMNTSSVKNGSTVMFLEAAAAVDRFLLRVNQPVQYTVITATVLHMIAVAIPNVPRAYIDYARFPLLSGIQQHDTYGTDTNGNSYVAKVVLNDPLDMYTKARLEQTPLDDARHPLRTVRLLLSAPQPHETRLP